MSLNYLYWIDMEMTGLNPDKDRILEVALIITDIHLKPVETFDTIVFQTPDVLNQMDSWCITHHKQSGLTAKIPNGVQESEAEENLIQIIKKYSKNDKAVIAGNSIHQDRKFIDKWMPKLSSLLHYRMLDISSFKIIFESQFKKKYQKKTKHRALEDIQESIDELKFYLNFIKPSHNGTETVVTPA